MPPSLGFQATIPSSSRRLLLWRRFQNSTTTQVIVHSLTHPAHFLQNRINHLLILNYASLRLSFRYSTSQAQAVPFHCHDILPYIESKVNDMEGPSHLWINMPENISFFERQGCFCIIVANFLQNSQTVAMFEKAKFLRHRFPELHLMGFHLGSLACCDVLHHLLELIIWEHISFPILLTNLGLPEEVRMETHGFYIFFTDFKYPVICHEMGQNIRNLMKAVEELHLHSSNTFVDEKSSWLCLKRTWLKPKGLIKEPESCLQNLLFHFPGGISADEDGNRLFLSDSNHHRIIIFNGDGTMLDCIGSCPGFEDGEFESSKLMRPAALYYQKSDNCLYIVDSENHAIRRADLDKRVLETLYPPTCFRPNLWMWTWISDKLGFEMNHDAVSERCDSQSLMFPWHLFKSANGSFIVISRSFETLWILNPLSGEIKEIIEGFSKVFEKCAQLIMMRVSLLRQMPCDWLKQQTNFKYNRELKYGHLISCVTCFKRHIVICDEVAQVLLKFNTDSRTYSNFQFSNFRVLGFPYWLSVPLEESYSLSDSLRGLPDHIQKLKLLPGKINIQFKVHIPVDTELADPLQGKCIWRQASGAATILLEEKENKQSTEKVGVAQQWYEELDSLAFSTLNANIIVEDANPVPHIMYEDTDVNAHHSKVQIDCVVNASPGTSEIIMCAAIYLKLKRNVEWKNCNWEKDAATVHNIVSHGCRERRNHASLLKLNSTNLREIIFVRNVHVRVKLDCLDYPKADNLRDIVLNETAAQVDISL